MCLLYYSDDFKSMSNPITQGFTRNIMFCPTTSGVTSQHKECGKTLDPGFISKRIPGVPLQSEPHSLSVILLHYVIGSASRW